MEPTMGEIRDQRRAAALVATIVLTAGMFAGFAFGTTARDLERHPAPLLLQSGIQAQRGQTDCPRPPEVRQVNAAPGTAPVGTQHPQPAPPHGA